ncbi:MAG TPA: hypothetical protein VLM85_29680 [Polyangiaceae bacterium]|nr:hypothetical protein [Polyangiaceae bacterium]
MPFFRRPDGKLVRDVPATRRIMPYLMRRRSEATVYFEQTLDLTRTLEAIERHNARGNGKIGVFHVFVHAALKAMHARPRLNRFTMGGRVYQRDGIWIAFSAKRSMDDSAPLTVAKRKFDPEADFAASLETLRGGVAESKTSERTRTDKELGLVLALPSPFVRFFVWLVRFLDDWNLLPGFFIHGDPMYASLFVANLGSVGLDAAFHHLYEYGNCPIFAALGRVRKETSLGEDGKPVTRSVCTVRYSFDERIEDGLYCAAGLGLLKEIVEKAEFLAT